MGWVLNIKLPLLLLRNLLILLSLSFILLTLLKRCELFTVLDQLPCLLNIHIGILHFSIAVWTSNCQTIIIESHGTALSKKCTNHGKRLSKFHILG